MYCENCGKKIPDNAAFCEFCGEKTKQPTSAAGYAAAESEHPVIPAAGNPGAMGTGILAGTRQKMTSEFKFVSSVTGIKKRNTIKLNQRFAKNQVYVKSEDYDFVWKYITDRCTKAEIR